MESGCPICTLLNEPSTPVTKGKKKIQLRKLLSKIGQDESDEEEETPVQGEETTDDEEDMEEENSDYVDDEDAEGTTEKVPRDPYDSQDDMEIDSGGKAASLAHDDDVGHDFIAESVTADKGNDKGEDPANEKVEDPVRIIHFTLIQPQGRREDQAAYPLPSPNQQEEQPMKDNFKQQLGDDIVQPPFPTETTTPKPDLPIAPDLPTPPADDVMMSLLERCKTIEEDVEEIKCHQLTQAGHRVMFGNMGNVFNSTIASWEDRFSKDLFHNYHMMDDRVRGIEQNIADHGPMTTQIRMRHDQLTVLPSPDDAHSSTAATMAGTSGTSKEDDK
ncbi:hypothetical protein Scep_013356 [Stephania cephalantha]|uniref:Uncharacterized protein n=1 Tax=Stephania cephalantha TaxID=152367 RepID=A0AAP0JGX8_9MAGN